MALSLEEEVSLFLMQSTMGVDYETLDAVKTKGINTWLDEQLAHTYDAVNDSFKERTYKIFKDFQGQANAINANGIRQGNATLPYNFYFRMAWWHRTLAKNNTNALGSSAYNISTLKKNNTPATSSEKGSEVLNVNISTSKETNDENLVRHRISQALSEILVISDKSVLDLDAVGMASYYDLLYKNAFGTYADLLYEVSIHPMMGVFLSHMNNVKEDSSKNIHPDENYAREIMQLFTIGLNKLDDSAVELQDANGKPIPTYDNSDIKELAKVFTGLKAKDFQYEYPEQFSITNGTEILAGTQKDHKTIPFVDMINPMINDSSNHDNSNKNLSKVGISISGNASTLVEIREAVDKLVAHANTAPFIAKKLIQLLVSSNPSKSYIKAVADAFKTNSKGDLKAAIKEIFTNSEARSSNAKKLKSPLLRISQLLKAFKISNTSKKLWYRGDGVDILLNNHVLSSPTVFNFYLPNFSPHGSIENSSLVAPEFQLHNSSTSIEFPNFLYDVIFADAGTSTFVVPTKIDSSNLFKTADTSETADQLKFDFGNKNTANTYANLAKDKKFDELIEKIALVLTAKKTLGFENSIKTALGNYDLVSEDDRILWTVQTVIYLIAISPNFNVLKA